MLRPFHEVSALRFYIDLILTAMVLWLCLFLLSQMPSDIFAFPLFVLAYLVFFRANAFVHEVVHFQHRIKYLGPLYNILLGFPNRVPLYFHEPHHFHHMPTSFGTEADPEYLYLKGKGALYFFFPFFAAPFYPIILLVRFGILPLFLWILPRQIQERVFQRFSTLVVNPGYERPFVSMKDLSRARWQDLGCSAYLVMFLVLFGFGVLNFKFFILWYVLAVLTGIVNVYRARVAHIYDSPGGRLKPFETLRDSITIEGNLLTCFWAPLGLNYHSLHHLAPYVPYYNLGRAHAFLRGQLEPLHPYHKTIQKDLTRGLRQYLRTLKALESK